MTIVIALQAAAIVANLSLGINTPEFPELMKNNSNNNMDENGIKSS